MQFSLAPYVGGYELGDSSEPFGAVSRQPPKDSMTKKDLQQDHAETGSDQPGEQFTMMGKLLHDRFALLELIDFSVNRLEMLRVIGPIILSAGHIRDLFER